MFDYINTRDCFETVPPARDDVLPGLPPRTVGSIVAPGAAGKTLLALQAACCLAAGKNDFMGLWRGQTFNAGQVLVLSAEDPPTEVHRRLHAIGGRWPAADRDSIYERLHIADRYGRLGNDLLEDGFAESLCDQAADHRLVVIDTLRRFHQADENDGGAMAKLVARLEWLARESGAAVLFLHHASKAAALNGSGDAQQASRGSSVLADNIRWQINLITMSQEEAEKYGVEPEQRRSFVRVSFAKLNYAPPAGDLWLRRTDGGVMIKAQLSEADGKRKKQEEKRRSAERGRDVL